MTLMDRMDDRLEKTIKDLPDNEKNVIRNIKSKMMSGYEFIKPVLLGLALFWIFYRIRDTVGIQEAFFIEGIVIIIFLRIIASRLA